MRVPPAALLLLFSLVGALVLGLLVAGKDHVVQPKTILLTGFGPFGTVTDNPSWAVARRFDGRTLGATEIRARRLDVSYAEAWPQIEAAVAEVKPDAIVLLGVAPGDGLRLEMTARNRDTSEQADVAGVVHRGEVIRAQGAETLPSRLPLERIRSALEPGDLGVAWSQDAGGYLCNHVFYAAVHDLPATLPVGFIHVPHADLDRLEQAVETIVTAVAEHLADA